MSASTVEVANRVSSVAWLPKPTTATRSAAGFAATNAAAAAVAFASAFDLLVQISRLVDGSRRVTHVTEVLRMESDVITLQDVFVAKAPDEEQVSSGRAKLLGPLECTGLKPHFLEKLAANGVVLPPTFFTSDDEPGADRPASFSGSSFGGY